MSEGPFETRTIAAGRGSAGELTGRAVLVVPLDGVWELHDKDWNNADEFACQDSYWADDAASAYQFASWAIEWVDHSELAGFIDLHWPEFADRGFETS